MSARIYGAAPLLLGAAFAAAVSPLAGADPSYVSVAVGYQASGAPKAASSVKATAAEAKQAALQSCRAQLAACAPAGTSSQCIAIATGLGAKWTSAEGADKSTAEASARSNLTQLAIDLYSSDTEVDPRTTAACAWD